MECGGKSGSHPTDTALGFGFPPVSGRNSLSEVSKSLSIITHEEYIDMLYAAYGFLLSKLLSEINETALQISATWPLDCRVGQAFLAVTRVRGV